MEILGFVYFIFLINHLLRWITLDPNLRGHLTLAPHLDRNGTAMVWQ